VALQMSIQVIDSFIRPAAEVALAMSPCAGWLFESRGWRLNGWIGRRFRQLGTGRGLAKSDGIAEQVHWQIVSPRVARLQRVGDGGNGQTFGRDEGMWRRGRALI
jgi:hypothetical protein